jgi:uncharacterized protein (TIRG00374 family)
MLMQPIMPTLPLSRLFGIYCMGIFFNLAFPTTVGGDLVKIYYAGKSSNMYAQSFAATFLDRDTGLLALLGIACISSVLYPVSLPKIPVSLIIWCTTIVLVLGNILIFAPGIHQWILELMHRIHLAKMVSKIVAVTNAFQITARHKSILIGSIAISLLIQFLYISFVWFISQGLGLNIPFHYFLIFVPIINIITMIPVSLNGIGLREYAFLSLFGAMNVVPASCIALGLVMSFMITLSSFPGGIVYIIYKNSGDAKKIASLENRF